MGEPMTVSALDEYGNLVRAELMPEGFELEKKKASGTGGGNGGGSENTNSPEKGQRRSFLEIQKDRVDLIDQPENRNVEAKLALELATIIREYEDRGLLNGIRAGVANLQNASAYDFPNTMQTLSKMNIDDYMRAIATKGDVDIKEVDVNELELIITEYKDVAVLVMTHAYEIALKNVDRARDLKREIDLRSWNSVPTKPYSDATIYVSKTEKRHVITESEPDAGFESQFEEKVKKLKKENAEATEWARVILEGIDFAEKESDKERKKSVGQDEKPEYWKAIEKAIQEIPNNIGSVDRSTALSKFLEKEYKEGLTFKDRMSILFSARRHLNDRFVEMSRAGGSLTKMGVSDDMPFEGISYKVQPISPEDFEMLYHQRELFPELSSLPITELRELLPDLDEASCKWLDVGIKNSSIPDDIMTNEEIDIVRKILDSKVVIINYYSGKIDERTKEFNEFNSKKHTKKELDNEKEEFNNKTREFNKNISEITKMSIDSDWVIYELFMKPLVDAKILKEAEILTYAYIPTFDNSLNNATTGAELRKRMASSLKSNKGEDLAFRVLTNTLTFEMLDRGRSNVQGSSEPRDIIWAERKRLYEMEKERQPDLDWTVHRYFVTRFDPEQVIKEDEAEKSEKLAYRREMLAINAERGALIEKNKHFEGEIVSDFFHNVMIFAPDELKAGKSIRRNLATYILNADNSVKAGGFKDMPFLEMGTESYSTAGYWGYTIAKAKQLANEISSVTYKKADEELTSDDWWNKKRDLFARLEHISPRLITVEFKARGKEIRKLLSNDGRFDENEIKKIAGYSRSEDLSVITNLRLRNVAKQVILDDIEKTKKEKKRLFDLANEAGTNNDKINEKKYKEMAKEVKNLTERASDQAKINRDYTIDEFRLIHALGVVWTGSVDSIIGTAPKFSNSAISNKLLTKIRNAIISSRYLEGKLIERFDSECDEMGFGYVGVNRKVRYRESVNPEDWN